MIPIPLVGQQGGHRGAQFSSEVLRNMYLSEVSGSWGCHDFPGLKAWAASSGNDRGSHRMAEELYHLLGNTLYRVDSGGAYNSLGSVGGSGRAIFADDGTSLYLVTDGNIYRWFGGALTTVSQGVVGYPYAIAYINKTFILSGENGVFATSNIGDGTTYNGLSFAEAEVSPDKLWRPYVFKQLVYMVGYHSTEMWYYSDTVRNPPLVRQDTALVDVGMIGRYAITNTDQALYWMGDDRKFYKCIGANHKSISTSSIADLVEGFSNPSDCIATSFVFEGQDFILFTFPTDNWSLVYSEKYDYWTTLGSGTSYPGSRWLGVQAHACYDKTLIAANGAVFELDPDTYTDNGQTRLRVRTIPSFTGKLLKQPTAQVTVTQLRINMEVGVGLVSGQGSAPVIMCQFSPDGGKTWQAEQQVSIGASGDYIGPVDFWDFCTGYEVRARIKCSDPVYLSIWDGAVDLQVAGY